MSEPCKHEAAMVKRNSVRGYWILTDDGEIKTRWLWCKKCGAIGRFTRGQRVWYLPERDEPVKSRSAFWLD